MVPQNMAINPDLLNLNKPENMTMVGSSGDGEIASRISRLESTLNTGHLQHGQAGTMTGECIIGFEKRNRSIHDTKH